MHWQMRKLKKGYKQQTNPLEPCIKILWSLHDVKLVTNLELYNVSGIPSLLYCTEALMLYEIHIKQLTAL